MTKTVEAKQFIHNERDMRGATIVAEHYGAPLDWVARILETSIENTRRITKRWRESGLMDPTVSKPVPGHSWIYPTTASAEALLGHPVRHWRPRPMMAAHNLAVLQLRLALVGPELGRWVSERTLRYEAGSAARGQRRLHVHDGHFITDSGRPWAVEVELTRKPSMAAKTAVFGAYQAALSADAAGLTYYCRGAAVKKAVQEARNALTTVPSCTLRVADLDEDALAPAFPELFPAGGSRPGLTLIAGGSSADQLALGVAR